MCLERRHCPVVTKSSSAEKSSGGRRPVNPRLERVRYDNRGLVQLDYESVDIAAREPVSSGVQNRMRQDPRESRSRLSDRETVDLSTQELCVVNPCQEWREFRDESGSWVRNNGGSAGKRC